MAKFNVGIIIQARCGSKRFPKKIFANINGRPMISILCERLKTCKKANSLIIATTTNAEDKTIEDWGRLENIKVYLGSEDDVLGRFYDCSLKFSLTHIVRITADDPLKCPQIIDDYITVLTNSDYDYVSNTIEPTYPEGLDIECFTFSALEKANTLAKLKSEREHVTPCIYKNPSVFKVKNIKHSKDYSNVRLTVDYLQDLKIIKHICSQFDTLTFTYEELLNEIISKPEIYNNIQNSIQRNESYLKDIKNEST